MRQSSADLFPTDQPLPASQIIGRREDVDDFATSLQNGQNLIVVGPRRTGKTSVCDAALTRVAGAGFYTATVDLFRAGDAAELAEALATAVLANRSGAHKLVDRARRAGRSVLSAAQATAVMKLTQEFGEGVEVAVTPGFAARDPERALSAALELPDAIARADDTRLILFLDEFQEVAGPRKPYGDPDALTKRMRAIFQRTTNVTYLFAGSLEHVMRDLFAPTDRAFSGFGSVRHLRPISREEWTAGLTERFAADDCRVEDAAMDRLVTLGGRHPRVTMLIAQHAHLLSIRLDTRDIGEAIVLQAYEEALRGEGAYLDQLAENVRTINRHALRYARRIATGEPLTPGIPKGDATRCARGLVASGIVERTERRGIYLVVNPLFAEYLRRQAAF